MDPEYESIFQSLYSARPERGYAGAQMNAWVAPDLGRDAEVISRAIDEAEAELQQASTQTLRSDAKYFLLTNLLQMVFIPLRIRGGPLPAEEAFAGFKPTPAGGTFVDLISVLRDDLRLILRDAASRQVRRESFRYSPASEAREISSHLVMEAIVANWSQLGLNSFRIWGER